MDRGATSVYQYFDSRGSLIYVGVTNRGTRRMSEHADTKTWWPLVVGCTVEHFATRDEALARETDLIVRYQPPYNTASKKKTGVPRTQSPWRNRPVSSKASRCLRCNEARQKADGMCGRCLSELNGHGRGLPVTTAKPTTGVCPVCELDGILSAARGLCRSCEGKAGRMLTTLKET